VNVPIERILACFFGENNDIRVIADHLIYNDGRRGLMVS